MASEGEDDNLFGESDQDDLQNDSDNEDIFGEEEEDESEERMKFCPECSWLMQPSAAEDRKSLVWKCMGPGCEQELPCSIKRVYANKIKQTSEDLLLYMKEGMEHDPTLPRASDAFPCPRCGMTDVVFLNAPEQPGASKLYRVFMCRQEGCRKKWQQ